MALHLTYAISFLAFISFTSARMLLSLDALNQGASTFSVGVISSLFWVFPMLLSWPIGAASDKHGSRGLLTGGSVFGVLSLVIPGWLHGLPWLYLSAGLGGVCLAVYNVVAQNVVGLISKPEQRTRNFANFTIFGSTAGFTGPLLTGFCIDHGGYAVAARVMLAAPVLGLLALLAWGRLLPRGHGKARQAGSIGDTLTAPGMQSALVIGAIVTVGIDTFQFYLPVYGHNLGLSASSIGMVTAVLAVAMFGTRVVMQSLIRRLGEEKLLMIMLFFGALAYLLVPLARTEFMLGVVAVIFGLAMGCGQPITIMLAYSLSSAARAGEALGVRLTVNNLVRVVGPMLFGSVGAAFGMLPMFWLNAGILGGGGMISRMRVLHQARTAPVKG